jgi:hypothetical protein
MGVSCSLDTTLVVEPLMRCGLLSSLAAEADAVEAIARATITLLRKAMMLPVVLYCKDTVVFVLQGSGELATVSWLL